MGDRARMWAQTLVRTALRVMGNSPAWAVVGVLARMDSRELRRALHVERQNGKILFETTGAIIGQITTSKTITERGRQTNIAMAYKQTIDVSVFKIIAPEHDAVAQFMEGYLQGRTAISIPLPDQFTGRDPLHVLAASRIVEDPFLATTCEVIWEMDGVKDF